MGLILADPTLLTYNSCVRTFENDLGEMDGPVAADAIASTYAFHANAKKLFLVKLSKYPAKSVLL